MLAALALIAAPLCGEGFLIVAMDDVGSEHLSFHPMGQDAGSPAPTPVLDGIAASGINFTNAWAMPKCSPTRASMLTGRWGFQTGVTDGVDLNGPWELALGEETLAERMLARGFATAAFGKWHLSNGFEDVCAQGFQLFDGTQRGTGNPNTTGLLCSPGCGYEHWERVQDTDTGVASITVESGYATTVTADSAIAWIQAREAQDEDWFAVVSFNACHKPYHVPPSHIHPITAAVEADSDLVKYQACLEAVDTELGRLLGSIDMTETTALIVSDNGSPNKATLAPVLQNTNKGTAYRGGIEVMLLATGSRVDRAITNGKNTAGQEISGHVNVIDIFRTTLKLAGGSGGGPWNSVESLSFYNKQTGTWEASRTYNYAERSEPMGRKPGQPYTLLVRAVESGGWKLIEDETGAECLFDVDSDPWEWYDVLLDGVSASEQATLDVLYDIRDVEVGVW